LAQVILSPGKEGWGGRELEIKRFK
jgi:hypothetical protein